MKILPIEEDPLNSRRSPQLKILSHSQGFLLIEDPIHSIESSQIEVVLLWRASP